MWLNCLDGVARLAERGGDGVDADGATLVMIDDDGEQPPVHLVQAGAVDLQPVGGMILAMWAISPLPSTSAKSRARRSRRLATRGVPRDQGGELAGAGGDDGHLDDARAAGDDLPRDLRWDNSRAGPRSRSGRAEER